MIGMMRVWLFIERPSANPRKSQPIASRNLALILPLVGFAANRRRSERGWTRASALAFFFLFFPLYLASAEA